jgi:hypothetical protein
MTHHPSSRLLEEWDRAVRDLKIEIIAPYEVDVAPATTVTVDLLVRNFGGRPGTLVVTDYSRIEPHAESLAALGYGFSVLSEPGDQPWSQYDRGTFIDMLSEWGWTGPAAARPAWLQDRDADHSES